jgi:polysaccharide export outer membrane protein
MLQRVVPFVLILASFTAAPSWAQRPEKTDKTAPQATTITVPSDYVIGTDDVLGIVFWRDKDMTVDVVVRPDGNISLPLINDVKAAGYTPDQLRELLVKAAAKFIADPNATVVVKAINSRKVYITGQVAKPNGYSLSVKMNVVQLIALAGGVLEYADSGNILIMRGTKSFKFNYKDVLKQKNLEQNIELLPGDTVIVP